MPKPDQRHVHDHKGKIRHEASKEFTEIFDRLEQNKAIDADCEVIETEGAGD